MNLFEKSKKPDEFFLITHYVSRRMAYPLALLCRRAGLSANAITVMGGLSWVASVATILLAGWLMRSGATGWGWAALLLTAALWNAGYILDVVDGSLARMTESTSRAGYYLDFSFHLVFNSMFLSSVGIFLYMITSAPLYAILAALSPCCNWGLSFSAKEHVLCEDIALNKYSPDDMTGEERYAIYIDSPKTKAVVAEKTGALSTLRHITSELFCFPGQFTLFSLVLAADLLLRPWQQDRLILLKTFFVLVTLVLLFRVPFRLRREFDTMRRYDALAGRRREPPVPGTP